MGGVSSRDGAGGQDEGLLLISVLSLSLKTSLECFIIFPVLLYSLLLRNLILFPMREENKLTLLRIILNRFVHAELGEYGVGLVVLTS